MIGSAAFSGYLAPSKERNAKRSVAKAKPPWNAN